MRKHSEWAKLPLRWIHSNGLTRFSDRMIKSVPAHPQFPVVTVERPVDVEAMRNECIAALRLYLVLCCQATFNDGVVGTTYPKLMQLAKMSRPVVAKGLARLEQERLISRKKQPRKMGSALTIEGWHDEYGWGKIPKLKLYDWNTEHMLLLSSFNYSKASFNALKIYIALLAYRGRSALGIAILSYDKLSTVTGVPRYQVADAVTKLYDMDLISFRPGDFDDEKAGDRTNRYLVKGLGGRWPSTSPGASAADKADMDGSPSRPTKAELKAAEDFFGDTPF